VIAPPGALSAFGWSERVLALFNDLRDPTLELARVARVERSSCVAVRGDGTERPAHAHPLPAVGDWVALDDDVIRAVLPRWSAITRADPNGIGDQVLASNVDLVLVAAPADRLSPARVERELAVAWETPLVLLTKFDLAGPETLRDLSHRLAGTDIVPVSVQSGTGLDELGQLLRPSRTAVLFGPSGAGKSSLLNALVGDARLAVGAVREGDHRGRHTTSWRQLVALPSGGVLIDTPGLRSLGLTADTTVEQVFPEIEALAAACRFRDCRHEHEPGCAVADATARGVLDAARVASFRKLERELAVEVRRHDPLQRQATLQMWKARTKAARLNNKRRGR
jgi:ribosome biogenesis GTPase